MKQFIKNNQWLNALLALVILGMSTLPSQAAPSQAAIPDNIDYQGYLTDSVGAPLNSTVNITFNVYNVDIGGAPLWTDTQSVDVTNGLFNVKLGRAGNPFSAGLFDTPLWLGMNVAGDGEMSPRSAMASAPYAFKADDADSVGGMSAGDLDQSAHTTDATNPHSVTAAQVGAADAATLGTHTSNASNPHSVTAAQTGAATPADITTHTGNTSAHHSRYSNTEAVNAMGNTTDSNPLKHNKYTNANAVAAIKAADGAGSALDADLVDGMQANEIIDAAQDEVRTPISSLPFNITQSGSYYVTGNLTSASSGITITANDVTLDLMGFTLNGSVFGFVNHGINFSGMDNITIINGTIRNFSSGGVYQNSIQGTNYNARLIDLKVMNNGGGATGGIYISGQNALILRCAASDNSYYGIYVGKNAVVKDSTARGNGYRGINAGDGSVVSHSTSYNNASIGILGGQGSTLSYNTASSNGSTGIYANYRSSVTNSTARRNQADGIYARDGSTAADNTVALNDGDGIHATSDANIRGNSVTNNLGAHGIYAEEGSRVVDNVSSGNNIGIRAGAGSLIKGNTVKNNLGTYGIYAAANSGGFKIIGNTVREHQGAYGIYVEHESEVIGNTVTECVSYGISALNWNHVEGNTILANNTSNNEFTSGLRVASSNRVIGNMVMQNRSNAISVVGYNNVVESNYAEVIDFSGLRNFYRNNTAAFFSAGSAINGGGNNTF